MDETGIGTTSRGGGFRLAETLIDGGVLADGRSGALKLKRWVVQTLGDGWEAVIELEAVAGRRGEDMREEMRAVSVSINRRDGEPATPLTQAHRRLRLRDALRFAERAAQIPLGLEGAPRPLLAAASPQRPGRRGHGAAHYAELAAAHIDGAAKGRTVADVADDYGLSAKALRAGVRKAERLGLVTGAINGRMRGRKMTPEGEAALRLIKPSARGAAFIHEPDLIADDDASKPFWRDRLSNTYWRTQQALDGNLDTVSG